jgi:ribonuclease P protein component
MLSAANRLNLRFYSNHLRQIGQVKHTPFFTIIFNHSPSIKNSQFAVVVTKKISPHAVVRNRLKRRLTEIIRTNLDKFPSSLQVILIPKNNCLTAPNEEIINLLSKTLNDH